MPLSLPTIWCVGMQASAWAVIMAIEHIYALNMAEKSRWRLGFCKLMKTFKQTETYTSTGKLNKTPISLPILYYHCCLWLISLILWIIVIVTILIVIASAAGKKRTWLSWPKPWPYSFGNKLFPCSLPCILEPVLMACCKSIINELI